MAGDIFRALQRNQFMQPAISGLMDYIQNQKQEEAKAKIIEAYKNANQGINSSYTPGRNVPITLPPLAPGSVSTPMNIPTRPTFDANRANEAGNEFLLNSIQQRDANPQVTQLLNEMLQRNIQQRTPSFKRENIPQGSMNILYDAKTGQEIGNRLNPKTLLPSQRLIKDAQGNIRLAGEQGELPDFNSQPVSEANPKMGNIQDFWENGRNVKKQQDPITGKWEEIGLSKKSPTEVTEGKGGMTKTEKSKYNSNLSTVESAVYKLNELKKSKYSRGSTMMDSDFDTKRQEIKNSATKAVRTLVNQLELDPIINDLRKGISKGDTFEKAIQRVKSQNDISREQESALKNYFELYTQ